MVEDIAPALIEEVTNRFNELYGSSAIIKRTIEKIENGTATYDDAYKYSLEVGGIRAKAFKLISSSKLPNGTMYYNIAERLINQTLGDDYLLVSEYAKSVVDNANTAAGIGLKAQKALKNVDRLDGFIERLSNGEVFDDIAWLLDEPVKVFAMSVVDDTIKRNVEFQDKAGISVKLTRISEGRCCKWCTSKAGVYSSPFPSDIFARHDNCRCRIKYDGKKMRVSGNAFVS